MFKLPRSRSWVIVVNPPLLVAWAVFWVYGFYSAVWVDDPGVMLAINVALTLMFVYLMDLANSAAKRRFIVSTRDIAVASSFLALTLAVGWREVTDAICNDQFYHMQVTFAHGLRLLAPDVLPLGSALGQRLLDVPYRWLLYAVNVAIQAVLLGVFLCLHRLPHGRLARAVAAGLGFWLLRLVISIFVLRGDIHPPLRLLWLNFSSIFFGIDDFGLRLPGLIGLAVMVVYLVRRLSPDFGTTTACALAFAAGTVPIVWHVGTTAEASIWAAIAFVCVALAPVLDHPSLKSGLPGANSFDFLPLYSLLAFLALSRQSVFIAAIPLIAVHTYCTSRTLLRGYRADSDRKLALGAYLRANAPTALVRMWNMGYPLIIIVPWTLFIAHTGTPATDHSGIALSTKVAAAVGSGAAFVFLKNDFGWPWFVLMVAGLLPWCRRNVFVLAHFALALLLFYSITPFLWGAARYQMEIGVTAAVTGFVELAVLIKRYLKWPARLVSGLLIAVSLALVAYNIDVFKSIHKVAGLVDNVNFLPRSRDGSMPMLSELSYAFDDALTDIKQRGLAKGLYVDGTVYWVGGQILAGFDFAEISWNNALPAPTAALPADALDHVSEVKSVLYADRGEQNRQASINYLQGRGWKILATYPHYGVKENILYLLVRQ